MLRAAGALLACATIQRSVKEGHADPEILENLEKTIDRGMWYPEYLPLRYEP